jgi:hypothetical protein
VLREDDVAAAGRTRTWYSEVRNVASPTTSFHLVCDLPFVTLPGQIDESQSAVIRASTSAFTSAATYRWYADTAMHSEREG